MMEIIFQATKNKGRTLRNSGDQGLTQLFLIVARILMDGATYLYLSPDRFSSQENFW